MSNSLGQVVQKLCPQLGANSESAEALGQIIQEQLTKIIKIAKTIAKKRKCCSISVDDINKALVIIGLKPVYGAKRFVNNKQYEIESRDIFFSYDKEVTTQEVLNSSLPKPPAEVYPHVHWLAIEGVQPHVPENDISDRALTKRNNPTTSIKLKPGKRRKGDQVKNMSGGVAQGNVELKLPVEHILSIEQQTYLKKIQDFFEFHKDTSDGALSNRMIENLENDAALQPLIPYLMHFITTNIMKNLNITQTIMSQLHLLHCILKNEYLQLDLYSHHIMPLILNCLLIKEIGRPGTDDHLTIRDYAGRILKCAISKFDDSINNLLCKVVHTITNCLDNSVPHTTQYGAAVGLWHLELCQTQSISNKLQGRLEAVRSFLNECGSNSPRNKDAKCLFDALSKFLTKASSNENAEMYINYID